MPRQRGYYWIKFPYKRWGWNKPTHWEIGSWDPDANMWALIGSNDLWYESQLQEIGPQIAPPDVIELTKKMKKK